MVPNQEARIKIQLEHAERIGDLAAATMLRARLRAERAANQPSYAATEDGQAALAEAAELARIARRKAWSEAELREAWGR